MSHEKFPRISFTAPARNVDIWYPHIVEVQIEIRHSNFTLYKDNYGQVVGILYLYISCGDRNIDSKLAVRRLFVETVTNQLSHTFSHGSEISWFSGGYCSGHVEFRLSSHLIEELTSKYNLPIH
jgi:hypothetical protein